MDATAASPSLASFVDRLLLTTLVASGTLDECAVGEFGRFPEVVAIVELDPGGGTPRLRCSGVAVTPEHVLTAGHCTQRTCGPPSNPRLAVISSCDLRKSIEPDHVHGIKEVRPHPDYEKISHSSVGEKYLNDLSLLVVSSPVPASLVPAGGAPTVGLPATGVDLIKVGYGGPNLRRLSTIVAVQSTTHEHLHRFAPLLASTRVCEGDSGGPTLQSRSAHPHALIGVSSTVAVGPDRCGHHGRDTTIYSFRAWLTEAISPEFRCPIRGGP